MKSDHLFGKQLMPSTELLVMLVRNKKEPTKKNKDKEETLDLTISEKGLRLMPFRVQNVSNWKIKL